MGDLGRCCMDLLENSLEHILERMRRRRDTNSCPEYFLCLDEKDMVDDLFISNAGTISTKSTSQENDNIQAEHRNHTRKQNPRLLYNLCIGHITDQESRNLVSTKVD